ncbi:uncharacterized protein [Diadema antillarum]|uniref:uncharacterized protein n=1 Tax=Diadema antillarum TaxID=105358 RepID=UPI003A83FC72
MNLVNMRRFVIVCLMLHVYTDLSEGHWLINDLDHPCVRDCDTSPGPMTCRYDWTIESYFSVSRACYQCPFNTYDCHRTDCVPLAGYARPVLSVNRKVPGPTIQVCENDIIEVRVRNAMQNEEGTSIHWHGFHQRDTPYMDGVAKVTQCSIPAGQEFTYRYPAVNAGTHWWHSHSGLQRADGIYGSVIVRQTSSAEPHRDLYDVDDPHHVLVIAEWSKETALKIATAKLHGVETADVDGLLINGRGTNQVFHSEDQGNVTVDHHVVYVKSGLRHRFRVIGAMGDVCAVTISVDHHKLTIIAADGAPIEPVVVDRFTIFSGERYDFVLHADQEKDSYWIRAAGEITCGLFQEFAILRYDMTPRGVDPDEDKSFRRGGVTLNPLSGTDGILISDLRDKEETKDDLSQVDVTRYLEIDVVGRNKAKAVHDPIFYPVENAGRDDTYIATNLNVLNNITLTLPGIPLLTHAQHLDNSLFCNRETFLDDGRDCSTQDCECIHTLSFNQNQVVELVFINKLTGVAHPLHLHGYYFSVLGMQSFSLPFTTEDFQDLDKEGNIRRNFSNPPRKDTVMIPPGGYAVMRFRANNPGWWLMHCHFDTHLLLGMGLVVHVDGPLSSPPDDLPICTNRPPL